MPCALKATFITKHPAVRLVSIATAAVLGTVVLAVDGGGVVSARAQATRGTWTTAAPRAVYACQSERPIATQEEATECSST